VCGGRALAVRAGQSAALWKLQDLARGEERRVGFWRSGLLAGWLVVDS